MYDETGAHGVEDGSGGGGGVAGEEYWRSVFPQVTEEEIARFRVKYVGSEEELQDVKDAYLRYSGNVQQSATAQPRPCSTQHQPVVAAADRLQCSATRLCLSVSVLDSVPFADAESVPRICELLNAHCRARISKAQMSADTQQRTARLQQRPSRLLTLLLPSWSLFSMLAARS